MAQGGRPIDSVWKYFIKVEDGGKIRAKCIKCNTMISAKAARLRSHLEKCSQRELQYNSPNDDIAEVIPIVNSSDSILPFKKHVLCHKIYQPKLNDFTIKTNSHQKEILDDQIARLFYACNLPFSLAENDVFKKTISILRPGYTPPTRKSIAGYGSNIILKHTLNYLNTIGLFIYWNFQFEMAQGGRPIDSVWKYFIKVEDGGKIRAKCIKCNTMISAKAARLRSHLEKCSQRELQYNSPNDDIAEVIPIVNSSDSILPFKKHVLCHKIYQPKLNDFTIKTNSHQKEILDDQIARLFYACNLPFSLAENDVFKRQFLFSGLVIHLLQGRA